MKKIIYICSSVVFLLSCSKEYSKLNQTQEIGLYEKKEIVESVQFSNIVEANTLFLYDLRKKMLANPKLIDDIINHNITNSEVIRELNLKSNILSYEKQILSLAQEIVNLHPSIGNLDEKSQKQFVNELFDLKIIISKENSKEYEYAYRGNKNPCQKQFERDFHYIHGQYDARITGAAISLTLGSVRKGIFGFVVGSSTSVFAVGSAIWDIAVSIDKYNDCMRKNGRGGGKKPLEIHR